MLVAVRPLLPLALVTLTGSFANVDGAAVPPACVLPLTSVISGDMFYDFNANGCWDALPQEVGIQCWKIDLDRKDGCNWCHVETVLTDANGIYTFTAVPFDPCQQYRITERAPKFGFVDPLGATSGATWLTTRGTEGFVMANACLVPGPRFGNVRFEPSIGAGRSKGFWGGKSGKTILASNDPAWRNALNDAVYLRRSVSTLNQTDSRFSVSLVGDAFDAWSKYVSGTGANGHAGFILSTQIAATILSHKFGFMQGPIYVDRHQNGVLMDLDAFLPMAIDMLLKPDEAGMTAPRDGNPGLRADILACLNEFETINNTGTATNPQVVYGPATSPGFVLFD